MQVKLIFVWLVIFINKTWEALLVDAAILSGFPEISLVIDKPLYSVITLHTMVWIYTAVKTADVSLGCVT